MREVENMERININEMKEKHILKKESKNDNNKNNK